MSYILDALKKADRERNLGEVPDLETAHWGVRRQSRSPVWLSVIAALLGFNVLLAAYLLLDRGEAPATDEPVAGGEQPGPAVVTPIPRARSDPGLTETLRPRIAVREPVAPPPTAPAAPATRAPAQPPARVATAAPQPRTTGAEVDEYALPEWRELSLEFRSGFSLPRIDVHVYAEDPGKRFIMVELKKYREGETLGNGALLEKIHPGSIQLYYEGTRFRVDR